MKFMFSESYGSTMGSVAVLVLMAGQGVAIAQSPVELGRVHWGHDLAVAQRRSRDTARPVFLLFQEVPGCATCQRFGRGPLSHPLLVEAIEDLFLPVLVYNNREGHDAEVLSHFQEPAWNNPVVRFLDENAKDVIDRRDGTWSTGEIAQRMVAALQAADRPVPKYLQLVVQEEAPSRLETAELAMHCFWEGEAKLGAMPGVLATKSGWREGLEVVHVKFDAAVVGYRSLIRTSRSLDCASTVFAHSDGQLAMARAEVGSDAKPTTGEFREADASDRKYYLRNSELRHLPLTELQATRVNAALAKKTNVAELLSPRQRTLSQRVATLTTRRPEALQDWMTPENNQGLPDYAERLAKYLQTQETD